MVRLATYIVAFRIWFFIHAPRCSLIASVKIVQDTYRCTYSVRYSSRAPVQVDVGAIDGLHFILDLITHWRPTQYSNGNAVVMS